MARTVTPSPYLITYQVAAAFYDRILGH